MRQRAQAVKSIIEEKKRKCVAARPDATAFPIDLLSLLEEVK
jgi:hypothetical protein